MILKETINRLDLAFLIMSFYINYPTPPLQFSLVPYNYCALPLAFPAYSSILNKLLYYFCK